MTARLLRGSVPVRAVWLDPRWSPAIRREALALWEPGVLVQELDGGLLVRFPTPRRLDCALAPGMPFVEARDGLWAWAPTADEVAPPGHLHRLVRGLVDHVPLAALPDAELWRDLDVDAPIAAVTPLGPPPPPLPAPARPDVRARFGRPPPDPAAVAIREELAARGAAPVAVGWLPRLAASVLAWMDRRKQAAGGLAGAGSVAGAGAGNVASVAGANVALPAAPAGPGWLESFARRLAAPMLAPVLDRRHGRYLADLLALFEKNDLDAALRRAIPLGGGAGSGGPLPPALGLPTPRTSLALSPGRAAAIGSSIGVDEQLMKLLRDTYQRALDALVANGRVEDAAFVLVELLREHQKAVDLLEKHEKFALAAEIAEAAELGPSVVARLWTRAGQIDRAVTHARRTGSFPLCVTVIEAADAERGRAFRAAWAAHLAAGGDPAAAVGVCWPVPTLRPLALRWLEAALAGGGVAGARLLPLRLVEEPGAFDEVRPVADGLLAGDEPDDRALRVALAEGLCDADSPGGRALARPLLRRLVHDQAAAPAQVPAALLTRLRDRAGDALLAADLPAPKPVQALATTPVRWTLDPSDRGTAPVRDLALLPRGRVLLALGEAGCRVVDRTGRVLAVLDEPAEALVLHDSGHRAIAVARRGESFRTARLDLEAGTATRWIDLPVGAFTRTYDGSLWFLADGDALVAVDPLADRPVTLWRVDTGGPVVTVTRAPDGLYAVVGGDVRQVWRYALPQIRLTERAALADDAWARGWLGDDGAWVESPAVPAGAVLPTRAAVKGTSGPVQTPALPVPDGVTGFVPTRVERQGQRLLLAGTHDRGAVVTVLDLTSHAVRLRLDLAGATTVVTRLAPDTLAVGDDLGRAEVLSLQWGTRSARSRV